ncbi:MAG: hypothetical protein K2X47_19395, partial [Bdellovibrionales bacterium]|nr:hypothetical protein [Bdellovibrionales bacterium]
MSSKVKRLWPGFLIAVLSLLALGLTVFPFVSAGIEAIHFTQDPDMAYLGNGLNFIQTRRIHFILHPGVPTQVLIAAINLPFFLYSKVVGVGFEEWIYQNFDSILYYNRVIQSLILSMSIGLWLVALWKMTKSASALLLAWCFLFVYRELPTYGMAIMNENTGFLILSIWLLVLVNIVNEASHSRKLSSFFLIAISAVGFSNKFTNIFMPMISFLLPQLLKSGNSKERFRMFCAHASAFLTCFAIFVCSFVIYFLVVCICLLCFSSITC